MRLGLVAFAVGIALLQLQAALPTVRALAAMLAFGVAFAALLSGAALHQRAPALRASRLTRAGRLLGAAFVSLLLGFCWAGWRAHERLADRLADEWERRDITLTGVVASLPQRLTNGERFVFAVESFEPLAAAVPARILISAYRSRDGEGETASRPADVTDTLTLFQPGERWRLTVRARRPHGNANPHGFDYEAWLLERDLRATGSVRGSGQKLADFVWRPQTVVDRLRAAIRDRFVAALPDAPYLGVLIALAVGDQRAIASEQWTTFRRTGVTHLVSISGVHVTMVAALCAWLVDKLWRRRERLVLWRPAQHAAVVVAWLAAFAYALLAGFEVPAQRTLYMLSVVALALLGGRHVGVSRTLLLALGVVLLIDPWAVTAIGFWLSFGAVALLLLVGSARLSAKRGWRAALARWGAAQWAVTVGSMPLLLFFFQQLSLVSPLANALAIPLVSLVIAPLALVFALLPWPPLLAFDHWLLAQLMALLEVLARWPVWQQPVPPWPALLLALLGVVWLLAPRGFPARATGLVMLLPALFWPAPRPAAGALWVDVLDVGQGLAVVVRTATHTLLYDAGPAYGPEASAGERVVVPYLRAVGVGRLDALVISHRDQDHSGGYAALRAALPVDRLLTSIVDAPMTADPLAERCAAGQDWQWDGVRFRVLHPLTADYDPPRRRSNAMSCVLRVDLAGGGVLLTGDIEAREERALRARSPRQLPSNLLVVPHHGGKASSTPDFVAAVGARDVVFSAGYRNAFDHPHPEVVARYAASRQWRTDRDGALHVEFEHAGSTASVSAWRAERRRYWYGQ